MRNTSGDSDTLNDVFTKLYDTPTTDVQEKKGDYTYISWVYAVKALRENYPDATWGTVVNEGEGNVPMFYVGETIGFMVKCWIKLGDGQSFEEWYPVLDNRNKPIHKDAINVFDVNNSIKRCLTKLIAQVTGYGLKIFGGEDLPGASEENIKLMYQLADVLGGSVKKKVDDFYAEWKAKEFYPEESVNATIEQLQKRIKSRDEKESSEEA